MSRLLSFNLTTLYHHHFNPLHTLKSRLGSLHKPRFSHHKPVSESSHIQPFLPNYSPYRTTQPLNPTSTPFSHRVNTLFSTHNPTVYKWNSFILGICLGFFTAYWFSGTFGQDMKL